MKLDILNYIIEEIGLKYRAIEKLTASGQRQAYLATDLDQKCSFVIKLSPAYPNVVARIQREVNTLRSIDSDYFPKLYNNLFVTNENLEDIYDNIDPIGGAQLLSDLKDAKLKPFMITVEEYIDNIKWADYIDSFKSELVLVDFLVDIFSAVRLLWDVKIVHRDLKPDNILIKSNGKPVIIDLGIAKSFKEGTLDLTGLFFHTPCTPRFAAPEQLFNNKTDITYKTDQFSIGIIAFCILTGQFPYGDAEVDGIEQVLENIANKKIHDIFAHNVSKSISDIICKLIQVEPYKRYRNVDDIINDLSEARKELEC